MTTDRTQRPWYVLDGPCDEYRRTFSDTGPTMLKTLKTVRAIIEEVQEEYEQGAPIDEVLAQAVEMGINESQAEHEIDELISRGELYKPAKDHVRTT